MPNPASGSATSRLFDGLPRTHDADAHGATTLLVVRKPAFKELLAAHVELYDALLRLNCRRLRLMFDQFEDLNTRPLQARLAKQVLLLAKSYGIAQGEEIRIGLALAQEDLAHLLGASRQRVNQELKGFEREGAVRVEPTRPGGAVAREAAGVFREVTGEMSAETSGMEHFIGTRTVADGHAFDVAALAAWLQANLPGFEGPLAVEQFKGGQSNPTYKLITSQRACVMRSKPGPAAKLLPSAHAIEREFRVMRALSNSDVPVPRMLALCEDEAVIGRAFYVMEFVDGRVLWDQSLPGMSNSERAAIYDEMNRVIAALHRVDVAAAGLGDYGRPATTSNARSRAGASSTWRAPPNSFPRWTG